jgi:hypothetical protein
VGTRAPRGGYGFNVLFDDTQSNYIGDHHIRDLSVKFAGNRYLASDVPEPASTLLLRVVLVGDAGFAARRRHSR